MIDNAACLCVLRGGLSKRSGRARHLRRPKKLGDRLVNPGCDRRPPTALSCRPPSAITGGSKRWQPALIKR